MGKLLLLEPHDDLVERPYKKLPDWLLNKIYWDCRHSLREARLRGWCDPAAEEGLEDAALEAFYRHGFKFEIHKWEGRSS